MYEMPEMNDWLFLLVLNSLYNSPQFTFFLSLCPFPPACPLRTAPVHLNTKSRFDLSLLILLGFCTSLPPCALFHVDSHNMGVLTFSSLFLTFPHMLTQHWLSRGTSCCVCDIFMSFHTRVCLLSPPTPTHTWCRVTSRVSVRACE